MARPELLKQRKTGILLLIILKIINSNYYLPKIMKFIYRNYIKVFYQKTCHYNDFFYPQDNIPSYNTIYGKKGFMVSQFLIPEKKFEKLVSIVNTLMGENGCPWDKVQTRESLKPYLVEEAYETLEALDEGCPEKIKEELGDLLYQILFHAKISELKNEFDIGDVIESISEKMVRRHPHVFQEGELHTPEQVVHQWEEIKKKEKINATNHSILDNIPKELPSLLRAQKLQKKAAKQGFDWDRVGEVFNKLDEEITEFKQAVLSGKDADIAGELGDILFVLVNIAKFQKIDAEEALRNTNNKFIKRFQHIEREVAKRGKELKDTPLEEMEKYWQQAKNL